MNYYASLLRLYMILTKQVNNYHINLKMLIDANAEKLVTGSQSCPGMCLYLAQQGRPSFTWTNEIHPWLVTFDQQRNE